MHPHDRRPLRPFGPEHAAAYDASAPVSLPGYATLLEVVAASMSAALAGNEAASVLAVGVGTGQELLPYARHGAPGWRFTGVDTSPHMLAQAPERLSGAGLLERTRLRAGALHELGTGSRFDGAQMLGVLHHLEGEESRLRLLREVAARLRPGAPFVVGDHVGADPLLVAAEEALLAAAGTVPEKLARRREALAELQLPDADADHLGLLRRAGLVEPRQLFASLRFKVFLLRAAE